MKNNNLFLMLLSRPLIFLVRAMIRAYKMMISPYLPVACRYDPTCSAYMLDAIENVGLIRGLAYGLKRIGRCHPWGGHGYDPAPEPFQQKK